MQNQSLSQLKNIQNQCQSRSISTLKKSLSPNISQSPTPNISQFAKGQTPNTLSYHHSGDIPGDLPNLPHDRECDETETAVMGEGFDFNGWILQTLKECAPDNDEWKGYWNNFQQHKITEDVLSTLSTEKHNKNEVWKELIPIIGPRIRFQDAWEKELIRQQQNRIGK